jgi:hypothetical protein
VLPAVERVAARRAAAAGPGRDPRGRPRAAGARARLLGRGRSVDARLARSAARSFAGAGTGAAHATRGTGRPSGARWPRSACTRASPT